MIARFAVTIFLSAFLLFQVEPIIARFIVPWFGGSAAVWTTCLLFFQMVLLAGYLYSHAIISKLSTGAQRTTHLALLGVSALAVLVLHITPWAAWKPTGTEEPTGRILLLLFLTIGLPYFTLSTTGPLLQAWYAQAAAATGQTTVYPYRLYSLSNLGSMLALLSYPIVVEPLLPLHIQAWVWSVGFLLFAGFCGAIAASLKSGGTATSTTDAPIIAPAQADFPQQLSGMAYPKCDYFGDAACRHQPCYTECRGGAVLVGLAALAVSALVYRLLRWQGVAVEAVVRPPCPPSPCLP